MRLDDRDDGNRESRQIDREYAPPTTKVARIDPAIVRFSARPAEGETKTPAGAIGAALLEGTKDGLKHGPSLELRMMLEPMLVRHGVDAVFQNTTTSTSG